MKGITGETTYYKGDTSQFGELITVSEMLDEIEIPADKVYIIDNQYGRYTLDERAEKEYQAEKKGLKVLYIEYRRDNVPLFVDTKGNKYIALGIAMIIDEDWTQIEEIIGFKAI